MQMDRNGKWRYYKHFVWLACTFSCCRLTMGLASEAHDDNLVASSSSSSSTSSSLLSQQLDALNASLPAATRILSRRKRYLAFPDGSSVSAALCLTIGMIGNPNVDYLSWAVNWGVAYDLPNYAWVKQHVNGFPNKTKAEAQRRSRRSFYEQVQLAFDQMGFDGHACVARALCESAKYLQRETVLSAPRQRQTQRQPQRQRRGNMVEEIVRAIFSLPRALVAAHEPDEHHRYDAIYRRARREVHDCTSAHPGCHFSLLELALGKYALETSEYSAYSFM